MIKSRLLTILLALICSHGVSASENTQVVNLFEGDSLTQLNESQTKLLDFAVNLLIENDSVVILPQEVNLLIGDTAKVSYSSYPVWQSAYFQKDGRKDQLVVPTYAETPFGVVHSQMVVKNMKKDKYNCWVETFLSTSKNKIIYSGTFMLSNLQGVFLNGKIYNNGEIVGEIEGEQQQTNYSSSRNSAYQRYFENERRNRRDYSLSDQDMSPINRATKKNYDSTDMNKINKRTWTHINTWLNTKW